MIKFFHSFLNLLCLLLLFQIEKYQIPFLTYLLTAKIETLHRHITIKEGLAYHVKIKFFCSKIEKPTVTVCVCRIIA